MTGLYVASNVPAMGAQFQMQSSIGALSNTMTRLSTGLKINSAKDDPAGLIASELLKSDITATTKAITNTQRANGMINVATSALGQITSLLNDVRGLVVESANEGAMNAAMISANQLQIDASLDSIDRIARTTNYLGKKLIDGSLDYQTTGVSNNAQLQDVNITSANLGLASAMDVNIKVSNTADNARLFVNGTGLSEKTVVQIGGTKGTEMFNFGAGTSTVDMARAIANVSDATGVTAFVDGLASRGSLTLSSAGMNNDIVVSSKTVGKDAGNYTFRIVANTSGNVDSAKILSSPIGDKAGVVEVSLHAATVSSAKAVGELFDVSLYTAAAGDKASVLFQMGDKANVSLNKATSKLNADESGIVSVGATTDRVSTNAAGAATAIEVNGVDVAHMLNGWTVTATSSPAILGAGSGVDAHYTDFNSKTIFVNAATAGVNPTAAEQSVALNRGIAEVVAARGVEGTVTSNWAITTAGTKGLWAGDSFKLSGAASKDQLTVTYTSGMTAQQVSDMVNKSGLAQFQLTNASQADTVLSNSLHNSLSIGTGAVSSFESSYTAGDLVKLLKSDLGASFDFELLAKDTLTNSGSGRVSFMNAAVNYGDVNAGNAIQFKGTTGSPAIRMVNEGLVNQKLSFTISEPEAADIARGITSKILKINLATDAQGNSITTANDIVNLFNTSTAAQTLGVSASLIMPDGVDPNGRVWGETICGLETLDTNCAFVAGEGVVQATGWKDVCELVEYDMVFQTQNQGFVFDNSSVNINASVMAAAQGVGHNLRTPTAIAAVTGISTLSGTSGITALTAANVVGGQAAANALNGMSIKFTGGGAAAPVYNFNGTELEIVIDDVDNVTQAFVLAGINQWLSNVGGGNVPGAGVIALTFVNNNNIVDGASINFAGGTQIVLANNGLQVSGFEVQTATNVTQSGLTVNTVNTAGAALNTNALNGITFAFTSKASDAGFSVDSKTLTVYVDQATADRAKDHVAGPAGGAIHNVTISGAGALAEVNKLVNDAIKDNWQEIATVNRATEKAGDVNVRIDAVVVSSNAGMGGVTFEFSRLLANADKAENKVAIGTGAAVTTVGGTTVTGTAGNAANGKAVVLESTKKGVDYSNVEILFKYDANAATESAIFNQTENSGFGRLTVTHKNANLTAGELVKLINEGAAADLFTAKLATGANVTSATNLNTLASNNYKTTGGWYQGNNAAAVVGNGENPNGVKMIGGTDDNQRLVLQSTETGSLQDIRVNVVAGRFKTTDVLGVETTSSIGRDMVATINGIATKGNGNKLTLNSTMLQMTLTVDNNAIFAPNQTTSFSINGGGAVFQTGPQVTTMQQVTAGIKSMSTGNLGGLSGQLYQLRTGEKADMTTNTKLADLIVNEAISQVTSIAGRLGALQRSTLDPAISSLQDNLIALSDVEASISNADFAEETSKMARQQILVQTGARALAQLNQLPQYAQMLMG